MREKKGDFTLFAIFMALMGLAVWTLIADRLVRPEEFDGPVFSMQMNDGQSVRTNQEMNLWAGADEKFSLLNETKGLEVQALRLHPTGLYAVSGVHLLAGKWEVEGDAKVFLFGAEDSVVYVGKSAPETRVRFLLATVPVFFFWFVIVYVYGAMTRQW